MNECIFIGTVCQEVTLKESSGGKTYLNNSLATRNGKETTFINFTAFGKSAELINKFCAKGMKLGLRCHAVQNCYERAGQKVYTYNFLVDSVELVDKLKQSSDNDDFMPTDDAEQLPFV